MEKKTTKTTIVTETETITLTKKDIAEALVAHFGMEGGEVDFDVRMDGYLNGATITRKTVATSEQ